MRGAFCFSFIKCCLCFSVLSVRFRVLKRFPGIGQQGKPLLILLSVLGPTGTAPVDSYGHGQETGAPNLQDGPLPAPVRLRARAVSNSLEWIFSKGCGGEVGLTGSGYTRAMTQPKSSGLILPVRQRHRSTAIWRAMATMAFLRAAAVALGWPTTGHHLRTSLQSRCHTTIRQASSTSAVRRRTLPCLVIESRRWLLPLELTPPHSPV